ncbi:sulfite exporter TauE/SafE family protein [Marininema halotolerans]|uniref:Probable membrane transporter protein n=1 Tax=Marininema halotolerans TaxID=1155944 RepID=A0A1I6RX08_9BACL|nr:sulfite exporter TauE/SafE family protein [Marininema halotolerans]SFS69222.1 hypothetical protein SAMN05444972_1066 [Marininema halotolerans]
MDISFMLLLFLIGFSGSFISGMMGIGGSIVKFPMLLYIPPLLGFMGFTTHEVAGISAVEVFFTTLAGIFSYRKGGYLNRSLIVYMGTSILVGSFIGGYGSQMLSAGQINVVYAILATVGAMMMLLPKKVGEESSKAPVVFHPWVATSSAAIVGIASGIVGAAGAFLLVPIMLVILKIPTRMTIASSLAITFLSAVGSAGGKILTGQVLFLPALVMIIAGIFAAPLGAMVGKKTQVKTLQWMLATLIIATSIKIWTEIF